MIKYFTKQWFPKWEEGLITYNSNYSKASTGALEVFHRYSNEKLKNNPTLDNFLIYLDDY